MVPSPPLTADDLLQHREQLRDQGIPVDVEALTCGVSSAVRAEFRARLSRIEAAERAIEATWSGEDFDADPDSLCQPRGVAGRYLEPRIRDRGGMGYLCSAFDVELSRFVAYKVISPRLVDDPAACRRFFNEAEVTSRLNHPGVVPVYGRVIDDCGLPAYACAFVSGKSLALRIDEYRALDPNDLQARAEAFASLIGAFLGACEVVAHAHSVRVVHGDVKPLNIMTDDHDATRLVDWGLAQVVASEAAGASPDEAQSLDRRLGTRGFLSSYLGPPTFSGDIFALGRTLEMILGKDAQPALRAVADQAMRPIDAGRYASATALADDVRAVLADRAIAAYRDPWSTRLRRFSTRHRPTVAALVLLGVVSTVVGPVVGFRESGLRREAESGRRRAVELSRELIDQVSHLGKLQATLPGSRELLDRAVRVIERSAEDARAIGGDLTTIAEDYYQAGRINQTLGRPDQAARYFQEAADLLGRGPRTDPAVDDADIREIRARAIRDWGVVRAEQGRGAEAEDAWRTAREILKPVASRSPRHRLTWTRIVYASGNGRLLQGDMEGAQTRFHEARIWLESLEGRDKADRLVAKALGDVHSNLGYSLYRQAAPDGRKIISPRKLVEARQAFAEGLRLRRQLAGLEPGNSESLADVASTLNLLGNASQVEGPPSFTEAARFYREAADLIKGLVVAYPAVRTLRRELAQIESNLNTLLAAQDRLEEARGFADHAVEGFTRLVDEQPDAPGLHSSLGVALMQRAKTLARIGDQNASAQSNYQAALALAHAASIHDEPDPRESYFRLALTLLGDLDRQGYFQGLHAAELAAEPRFDRLRDRPGFPHPR